MIRYWYRTTITITAIAVFAAAALSVALFVIPDFARSLFSSSAVASYQLAKPADLPRDLPYQPLTFNSYNRNLLVCTVNDRTVANQGGAIAYLPELRPYLKTNTLYSVTIEPEGYIESDGFKRPVVVRLDEPDMPFSASLACLAVAPDQPSAAQSSK